MIHTLVRVNDDVIMQIEEEKRIRKTGELFLLFSLGSQFDHLIRQAIEKLGLFCLVADPSRITADDVRILQPIGIILSGGPASMYEDPPKFDEAIFDLGIPVLGICLGFQYWAKHIGCNIVPAEKREFGTHTLYIQGDSALLEGCGRETPVLQSHGDKVESPQTAEAQHDFQILGCTENASVATARYKHLFGVQFHPEVTETLQGQQIFHNFCFGICNARKAFPAQDAAEQKIAELRAQIGNKKVLLALSGGSDSSTVAYLLKAALEGRKGQVRAVYIRGIDRPDDEACVWEYFGNQEWIEVKVVDATDEFLQVLAGKTSMKEKRIAMRGVYKKVLELEAETFGANFIAQGTLYTDISESGGGHDIGAKKAIIKLHHNVGLGFSLPELLPLSDCFKDSGRNIGRSVGVPEILLVRHPFPGPGLVVRIEGEVTADRLRMARLADEIWIGELRKGGFYEKVWQAGAVVTESVVTCTKGDANANGVVIRLWAVSSVNGFTAQAFELPWELIKRTAQRITNEIGKVGSVDYRVSDKPPATIECG